MKKRITLDSKLKSYIALAMGVLGVGDMNAQIIYKDPPDKTISENNDTVRIKFDNDATIDFIIRKNVFPTSQTISLIPNSGNSNIGTSIYIAAMGLNEPITLGNSHWVNNSVGYLAGSYSGSYWGNFGDSLDHYIGCKFKIGSNNHLGWIRVGDIPPNASSCTVKDWAYNTTSGDPINAGQTTIVGIDKNKVDEIIKISNFNNRLIINNPNISNKGVITISNILGQQMKNVPVSDKKMTIDLSSFTPGIYLLSICNGKNTVTRKFSVK